MLEYIHQFAQHHIPKVKHVITLLLKNQNYILPQQGIYYSMGWGLPIKTTNFQASVIHYKIELHKNKLQL
jgi:hypothetical protein